MIATHVKRLNELLIRDESDSLDEQKKLFIRHNEGEELVFSFRGGFEPGAINVTFSKSDAELIANTLDKISLAFKSRGRAAFPALEIKESNTTFRISRDVLGEPFREVACFEIEIGDPSKEPTKDACFSISSVDNIALFINDFIGDVEK